RNVRLDGVRGEVASPPVPSNPLLRSDRGGIMIPESRPLHVRYATAVLSVALAVLVRDLLAPVLGDGPPFVTLLVAVTFSAWYGGFGPALTGVILGGLWGAYFHLPPHGTLKVQGPSELA